MSLVAISHWPPSKCDKIIDEIAAENFSIIMSVGASSVQILRMGDLGMRIIPQHSNGAAALSGQQKIANTWA
tara:strand:+ start:228 stop:443 length:216 start_codon:yes stop_codon:yes gene_type:complete